MKIGKMRHLKHNTTAPIDYIDEVIASKRERDDDKDISAEREKCKAKGEPLPPALTYKERCSEIRRRNEKVINKYGEAFNDDNLATVPQGVPVPLNGSQKDCEDMDGLYAFHSVPMGKLFDEVLSSDGYLNEMCPVCEAVKATTFDHYLPQSAYQLFAVHPLNLIPCCTVCNGHKNGFVFDDKGLRKFWNAYLDDETDEQYLFCDISEKKGMPKASFRVEQGKLPTRYFEIIKQTFDDLKLNKNYMRASGREIVRLKNSCCKIFMKNPQRGLDACLQTVADTIPDVEVNNWVNVLGHALIGTDIFKRFVVQALKQEHGIDLGKI